VEPLFLHSNILPKISIIFTYVLLWNWKQQVPSKHQRPWTPQNFIKCDTKVPGLFIININCKCVCTRWQWHNTIQYTKTQNNTYTLKAIHNTKITNTIKQNYKHNNTKLQTQCKQRKYFNFLTQHRHLLTSRNVQIAHERFRQCVNVQGTHFKHLSIVSVNSN
jgi:hypothetical protein